MGGEHHGAARIGQRAHDPPEAAARIHIQPDGGLIEHDELRVRQDRQREPHPLRLPAGELRRARLQDLADVGHLDHLRQRQRVQVQAVHHPQQPPDGGVGQQRPVLQHRPRPPGAHGRHRVEAEHPSAPGIRGGEPDDHLGGGGLACPVGAQQREDLAGGHVEVEAIDRGEGAVGLGEAGELDGCVCHASSLAPTAAPGEGAMSPVPGDFCHPIESQARSTGDGCRDRAHSRRCSATIAEEEARSPCSVSPNPAAKSLAMPTSRPRSGAPLVHTRP